MIAVMVVCIVSQLELRSDTVFAIQLCMTHDCPSGDMQYSFTHSVNHDGTRSFIWSYMQANMHMQDDDILLNTMYYLSIAYISLHVILTMISVLQD